MLFVISSLVGAAVDASDGRFGSVKDFLFDDARWRVRWLVVDTGIWLPGRKVLIHPSVIAPLNFAPPARSWQMMMMRMGPDLALSVRVTKQQIEASPDVRADEPVSKQMESRVYDYYGWDSHWGASYFGTNTITTPLSPPPLVAASAAAEATDAQTHPGDGDPHLRSVVAVDRYRIHATDGDIGHVEKFLADDGYWDIRSLVIATSKWWPGRQVRLAPDAVQAIDWQERHIRLKISRDQVKSSPPWDPVAMIDQIGGQRPPAR
jgi:hypothetical protein